MKNARGMVMASISRTGRAGASAVVVVLAACGLPPGSDPGAAPGPYQPGTLAPLPLADVFVLEASGGQPDDTTLTLVAGSKRVVVVRRSGPDYSIFARLEFTDGVLGAPAVGNSARLVIQPRPGLYALDFGVEGAMLGEGGIITFSYGAHFVAPAGARARYGSDLAFEKELAIGRLAEDGRVIFLPTARPGSDMLSAPLAGPGRYLVAAPR